MTYTGVTNNMARRLDDHQKGLNPTCFTYKRRPVKLIFHQEFNDVEQAIYFEKKIKRWSAKKKLALAQGEYDVLQLLALCRNETHSKHKNTRIGLDSARPDKVHAQFSKGKHYKHNETQKGLDSARPDKVHAQ